MHRWSAAHHVRFPFNQFNQPDLSQLPMEKPACGAVAHRNPTSLNSPAPCEPTGKCRVSILCIYAYRGAPPSLLSLSAAVPIGPPPGAVALSPNLRPLLHTALVLRSISAQFISYVRRTSRNFRSHIPLAEWPTPRPSNLEASEAEEERPASPAWTGTSAACAK